MKKVFSVFFITLMIFGSFSIGYCHNYPAFGAIDDDSLYEPLRQQSDLVKAFQAYCKSRDLTIEGSALDAVTTWTTSAFNTACNNVGLNISQIQAEIKAQYDENGRPLKYLFYATGVDAFNRIFAQFLQDNELEVGDAVDDTVYDGYAYNNYPVYIVTDSYTFEEPNQGHLIQRGCPYVYSRQQLLSSSNGQEYSFNFNNSEYTYTVVEQMVSKDSNKTINPPFRRLYFNNYTSRGARIRGFTNFVDMSKFGGSGNGFCYYEGNFAIIYNTKTNKYYFGMFVDVSAYSGGYIGSNNLNSGNLIRSDYSCWASFVTLTYDVDIQPVIINITTNNTVINNNTYEGDTIIYPDGRPSNPDDPSENPPVVGPDPDGPTDPMPPVDPNYPDDPVTPQTPPDWDIELPDFTDFDWIMTGLEKKFPWDIPFNIMFMMSLFVAEPEAPHFVGDIDLKVTTWHYDLDLAPFEEIAKLFRTFFFLGFLLGLMLLTKQLIWG